MTRITKAQRNEYEEKIDELNLEIDRLNEYVGLVERQAADAVIKAEKTELENDLKQFKKQISDLFYYTKEGITPLKDFFWQLSELINIPVKDIETLLIKPYFMGGKITT